MRRGPRVRIAPDYTHTHAAGAVQLAAGYGLTADPWQADVLSDWLGEDAEGMFTAGTCGLAVPRQNGKNGTLEIRELYGAVILGERVLHTAHEVRTNRQAFVRLLTFFERHQELSAMVDTVRKSNAQEAVYLKNGGSVQFLSRSKGAARGFTADVIICDEAQELTDEQLSALLPTISAAPLANPQLIMVGTPPRDPNALQGQAFRKLRDNADAGKRIAFTDYGAEDGPVPDVEDWELIRHCNPAYGFRLFREEVERERATLSSEAFARERLGWWGDPEDSSRVVDMLAWQHCEDKELPPPASGVVLAADVSPDRRVTSVGVGWRTASGAIGLDSFTQKGTTWAADRLHQMYVDKDAQGVALSAGAAALRPELEARGVRVLKSTQQDAGLSAVWLSDAVSRNLVRHVGRAELTSAAAGVITRRRGDVEVYDRAESQVDITPLIAAAHAGWHLASLGAPAAWVV